MWVIFGTLRVALHMRMRQAKPRQHWHVWCDCDRICVVDCSGVSVGPRMLTYVMVGVCLQTWKKEIEMSRWERGDWWIQIGTDRQIQIGNLNLQIGRKKSRCLDRKRGDWWIQSGEEHTRRCTCTYEDIYREHCNAQGHMCRQSNKTKILWKLKSTQSW